MSNRDNLSPNEIQDEDQDGLPDFRTVANFNGNYREVQHSQLKYRFRHNGIFIWATQPVLFPQRKPKS